MINSSGSITKMGLLLYTTEFSKPLPADSFRRMLGQLPDFLQPKILRYRRWQDAHADLFGKHLLRLALEKVGFSTALDNLHYTPQEKPYFRQGPHFNISHSGNRVVCLLSTQTRVGIDIEAITPIPFGNFQTQFTTKEWTAIQNAPYPIATFYRFWTAKESLIKADGRGLHIPLLDLDVTEDGTILLDGATWTFRPLDLFPGYACYIATEGSAGRDLEFHPMTPEEILTANLNV